MSIPFTKMHGTRNDFVCLDAVADPALAARSDLASLAAAVCDPRQGVRGGIRGEGAGADGLIIIERATPEAGVDRAASVRMRMLNADGSEAEMCGNGVRCVVKYAIDHGLVPISETRSLAVQTAAGVKSAYYQLEPDARTVEAVTVDMGPPILGLDAMGVDRDVIDDSGPLHTLEVDGVRYEAALVSMGNPHAVIVADDIALIDLATIGPKIERHRGFPQRINVHFIELQSADELTMRSWERGSGMTLACGSGACAVCVAAARLGLANRSILVHLPGGDLRLEWNERTDHVRMTGPAVEEFRSSWDCAPAPAQVTN